MAVAVRSSAADNEANPGTSFTVTIPSDVVTGDDLYVFGISRNATDAAPTAMTCTDDDSGGNAWTLVGSAHAAGDNGTTAVWWKKATSATASKTVTVANALDSTSGGIVAVSGALASGDPTTNMTTSDQVGGVESVAGFTPDYADSLIIFCIGCRGPETPTVAACTDPGDLEPELWLAQSTAGADVTITTFARVQTGGPTATGNFTWSQANRTTFAIRFAVRPAVTGNRRRRLICAA